MNDTSGITTLNDAELPEVDLPGVEIKKNAAIINDSTKITNYGDNSLNAFIRDIERDIKENKEKQRLQIVETLRLDDFTRYKNNLNNNSKKNIKELRENTSIDFTISYCNDSGVGIEKSKLCKSNPTYDRNFTNPPETDQFKKHVSTLTDDMFVLEAPSFIVPYIYEKPSKNQLREFVDKLGSELERKAKYQSDASKHCDIVDVVQAEIKETSSEIIANVSKSNEKKKIGSKKSIGYESDDTSWQGDSEDSNLTYQTKSDNLSKTKESLSPFECSLGEFFIGIGTMLVQDYLQNDFLKKEEKKLKLLIKNGSDDSKDTKIRIEQLYRNDVSDNAYTSCSKLVQKKCFCCCFKTESLLVMARHLEIPHMRYGYYNCNFCKFETRNASTIISHTKSKHGLKSRLEIASTCYHCNLCTYSSNSKAHLQRHFDKCILRFDHDNNLGPQIDWELPAKITKTQLKNALKKSESEFNSTLRLVMENSFNNSGYVNLSPNLCATRVFGSPTPVPMKTSTPNRKSTQASISTQTSKPSKMKTYVICEICDGNLKDLEGLRLHMLFVHNVNIHPSLFTVRPPLNCQKCDYRFFTDGGLERHLLGAHGLVTDSLKEASDLHRDTGRCAVCGSVFQWMLLNHMVKVHGYTLRPVHLSYKCTVCSDTFKNYREFELHIYSSHAFILYKTK